jgi:hypothetical protein
MDETGFQFISAHTLADRFEADVILNALREEGIPALLRPFEETPYSRLFVPQRGWGRVMVPKEMLDRAREIICAMVESGPCEEELFASAAEIDPQLWGRLRQADPEEIIRNAVVEYSREDEAYVVPFLNTVLMCYPEEERIEVMGLAPGLSSDFQLALLTLHYLLGARDNPISGKLVSEKDLPSGSLFFSGPHALPVQSLLGAFDSRPELLNPRAEVIGGEKINLGYLSYRFWIFPRIPVVVIFWLGDEEFESSFHILFDESITLHLQSLDQIWAMVNVFTRILTGSPPTASEKEDEEENE